MTFHMRFTAAACAVTFGLVFAAGCEKKEAQTQPPSPSAPKAADATPAPATQPLIPVATDWCREHAMPESVCVQCHPDLAAGYKAKGDWDEEHKMPKSQCFKCDPSLQGKFAAAFKQKYGKEPPPIEKE
jgi:hypothetical protein